MRAEHLWDLAGSDRFLSLPDFVPGSAVHLKLEGLNPAGSIKMKTARELIQAAESSGTLVPGSRIIESSSGSLGIALACLAAARGYPLIIVTDPNASHRSVQHMRALGAEVEIVTRRDDNGGFLGTRLALIRKRLAADDRLVWLNQYENPANPAAHRFGTFPEIVAQCGEPDWLFVGAGTTGTLMGCLAGIQDRGAATTLVAVDSSGSVTFGTPSSPRHIPGLGTSVRPPIFTDRPDLLKVHVDEVHAIRMCRRLATERGILVGGSTGTVLSAVAAMVADIPPGSTVVALSPDLGDRYLDTIYDDEWVVARFGEEALNLDIRPVVRSIPSSTFSPA